MAELLNKLTTKAEKILSDHPAIDKLFDAAQAKVGVRKAYLLTGIIGLLGIYLAFGWAAQLLCNIIAVGYPAYVSIKAVETHDKKDDTKWLTYWCVYGCFSIVEYFSAIITSFIPFYWLIKCIFYVWCFAPIEQNGSIFIYNRVIRPYFLKYEKDTDKFLDDAVSKVKVAVGDALKDK